MNKKNNRKTIEEKFENEDDVIHPEEDSEATIHSERIQSWMTILRRNGRIIAVAISLEE